MTDPNVSFYRNALTSRPNGDLIENILTEWDGNFKLLERHHGYIQWLFPVFENAGMNMSSRPLTKAGAALIRECPVASARVIRSYRLMLRFYGLRLVDERTGEVARDPEIYEERLDNLNYSSHNWLRVSRIITSLGELGFRRYKAPLLKRLEAEVESGLLADARGSLNNFWRRLLDEGSVWYAKKTLETAADRADGCLFLPGGSLADEAAADGGEGEGDDGGCGGGGDGDLAHDEAAAETAGHPSDEGGEMDADADGDGDGDGDGERNVTALTGAKRAIVNTGEGQPDAADAAGGSPSRQRPRAA